ncbi:hypothetical protein Tco_1015311 [Tanacetum coccineum]|uniref:Uncharacterized protein n=1 Tax=Tanacetum coccineum TaxID=301880 RepID=A0ABQ5FKE1_9ASTR
MNNRVLVPPGSVVVPTGSVITTGSILVSPGSVITTGSILVSLVWSKGAIVVQDKVHGLKEDLVMVFGQGNMGLTLIMRELLVIDMAQLVRLQICEKIDDTWAWVALGPERQPNAAAGAPRAAEDAPAVDESGQVVPAPVQAPPPPPGAARTMPQRMDRLEEDVNEIRGALAEQREVIGARARDRISSVWKLKKSLT